MPSLNTCLHKYCRIKYHVYSWYVPAVRISLQKQKSACLCVQFEADATHVLQEAVVQDAVLLQTPAKKFYGSAFPDFLPQLFAVIPIQPASVTPQ